MTYVLHLLYDVPPYTSCANFSGGCLNLYFMSVGISHDVLTSVLLYAAHECNFETRNAQYSRICRNVFARSNSTWSCVQPTAVADEIDRKVLGVASNLVEDSDVVVWLGDLNYRLELPRCSVISMIKSKMQEVKVCPCCHLYCSYT